MTPAGRRLFSAGLTVIAAALVVGVAVVATGPAEWWQLAAVGGAAVWGGVLAALGLEFGEYADDPNNLPPEVVNRTRDV